MRSIFVLSIVYFSLQSCANIGRPEGGPRDQTPPAVDSIKSTPMYQTNFHPDIEKKTIELYFNEWIQLENAQKQIVISPPLKYTPNILPKGKSIALKLDPRELLLENTTYTINFGEAIQDITERNPAKNLRFVFSTGPIIDSGKVSGKTFNAETGETKEDFVVMLYYSDADTVVYKSKPIYFSRTDKDGNFSIENIKDTTYKIFVLNDANTNYQYDQDKEEIGYIDRRVKTGEDSTTITIPYYSSYVRPRILNYNTDKAGVLKLATNAGPENLQIKSLLDTVQLYPLISKDTLLVFYTPHTSRNFEVEVSVHNQILDTIKVSRVRYNQPDSFKAELSYKEIKILAPKEYRMIEFNQPIVYVDTARIVLLDDTTQVRQSVLFKQDKNKNEILLECPCEENKTYSLTILPDAIYNYENQKNKDSVKVKIKAFQTEQAGNMIVTIDGLDSSKEYIVELMIDAIKVNSVKLHDVTTKKINFNYLIPNTYQIRIIQDDNKNGAWDLGNYRLKTQPEKILLQKNFSVRANWELREQINWKP